MEKVKILFHPDYDKRGGALWIISHMLKHFCNAKWEVYHRKKKGVYFGCNVLPEDIPDSMKSVLLVGGCRIKDNGVPRRTDWGKVTHVVFNSNFIQKVTTSRYSIRNSEVVYILGGCPSDPNICVPVESKTKPQDVIRFVVCAKWWKRPFKRLRQTVVLFNKYILPKYKNSELHVLGNNIEKDRREGNVFYHKKSFYNDISHKIYNQSHISLILTPFDTGPMTLTESMHYRIPFVSSYNCCGPELANKFDNKCGECVKIDPLITSYKHCLKYKPMTNKDFYNKELNYSLIMDAIDHIVEDYDSYTNWSWNDNLNYELQAKKWMNLLTS